MALLHQLRTIKSQRNDRDTDRSVRELARHERFTTAWRNLGCRILNWTRPLVTEGLLTVLETSDGAIHIDIVDRKAGTIRTSITPIDQQLIGSDGRIDVTVGEDRINSIILFDDGHWELYDPNHKRIVNKSFTALDVEYLIEQVLLTEAIK